jgi:hypothetical protein
MDEKPIGNDNEKIIIKIFLMVFSLGTMKLKVMNIG